MRKVKGGGLLESISAFIAERYYKRLHSGTCSRIRRELNPKSFDSFCSWKHVTAGSTAGPSAGKQWRETVQGFSHIKTALFFFSPRREIGFTPGLFPTQGEGPQQAEGCGDAARDVKVEFSHRLKRCRSKFYCTLPRRDPFSDPSTGLSERFRHRFPYLDCNISGICSCKTRRGTAWELDSLTLNLLGCGQGVASH